MTAVNPHGLHRVERSNMDDRYCGVRDFEESEQIRAFIDNYDAETLVH